MRFTITLAAGTDDGSIRDIPIALIERADDTFTIDDLGLRIEESKSLLAALQLAVVRTQAIDWCRRQRACSCCGLARLLKDHRSIMVRTPFGKIAVPSPRFRRCGCESLPGIASPIVAALPERVTPDLLELEAHWASLASYGITADRLADVLPVDAAINATTIRNDALRVAERLEAELGTERRCFIEGCEADWIDGPLPGPPVTVGIDGGYVRSWHDRPNNFEVIVGKSVVDPDEDSGADSPVRRFGFVVGHDERPRRHLHELLLEQGVGMDREVTFMSDGGRNVRNLQWDMRPNAEHILDYFHIAMRVTIMQQIARGLPPPFETDKDAIIATLERVRHFLWHGNWRRALDLIDDVETEILNSTDPEVTEPMHHTQVPLQARNLLKYLREFDGYISANASMIPNYGERRRYGEAVSTASWSPPSIRSSPSVLPRSNRCSGHPEACICSCSFGSAPSMERWPMIFSGGGTKGRPHDPQLFNAPLIVRFGRSFLMIDKLRTAQHRACRDIYCAREPSRKARQSCQII